MLITSSDPKDKLLQFCFLSWPYTEVPRLGLTDWLSCQRVSGDGYWVFEEKDTRGKIDCLELC